MNKSAQSTITQRFIESCQKVKSSGLVKTNTELAKNIGISIQGLTDILKGRREVTIEVLGNLMFFYSNIVDPYYLFPALDPNEGKELIREHHNSLNKNKSVKENYNEVLEFENTVENLEESAKIVIGTMFSFLYDESFLRRLPSNLQNPEQVKEVIHFILKRVSVSETQDLFASK